MAASTSVPVSDTRESREHQILSTGTSTLQTRALLELPPRDCRYSVHSAHGDDGSSPTETKSNIPLTFLLPEIEPCDEGQVLPIAWGQGQSGPRPAKDRCQGLFEDSDPRLMPFSTAGGVRLFAVSQRLPIRYELSSICACLLLFRHTLELIRPKC